ncbi:MAG: FAD-binding oxidoreductase [Opitutales bacterium]|nr:FAD-binding oxidoreductase [Opitutales bacterium]
MQEALDCIIVGQGIAGSNLALRLVERGIKIAIIDDGWNGAACRVAAGALNPITGKRLAKSWRSDVALPFAKKFYAALQKKFGENFYRERKILQLCKSAEEADLWRGRKDDPEYADFLSAYNPPASFKNLNDNFGSFFINFAAWVEAPHAMDLLKKHFLSLGILRLENFDYGALKIAGDFVKYKNLRAKKIVFCEGWRAIDNPYFGWLPYRPARGEILSVKNCGEVPEHIIHREKWLMKYGGNICRCGSTWDRIDFRKNSPTAAARAELEKALPQILGHNNFEIANQESGVRPCTATTRPHLGAHPKFKNLYSFNGFGSKGYALSPYFAEHFAAYLQGEAELDKEADLARHLRKFYKDQIFI